MRKLEMEIRAFTGDLKPWQGAFPWDRVRETDRREVFRRAEEYASQPYPMRLATGFLAFSRDGSRQADEAPYFFRRKKLGWQATACCLGRDAYLDAVADGIWCVCEESSWVISAHNVNAIPGAPAPAEYPLPDVTRPYVDLFSAQTGMILTLIRNALGRELDGITPLLQARITREIRTRILDPFLTRDDFWWMGNIRKDLCNWTPWILSNVMLCAMGEPMAAWERREVMIRACAMLDRWLDVVPEDGGCDEGTGYWNMAGGALLDCLEILERATDGRVSLWKEDKIRNILAFPARAEIGRGYFLNFADCDARPMLSGERVQTAGERTGLPEMVSLGRGLRRDVSVEMDDVPHLIRLWKALFHPPAAEPAGGENPEKDVWLPDLQVRVLRRGGWTLGAKGGHNGESHNHNDVGSFLLYLDGEPAIVDAGNMTYTAKTFSSRRYELWNTRSAYHNVPLIGGREQLAGAEYRAGDVECLPDGLRTDLAGAYAPQARVRHCVRSMTLTPEGLDIEDQIETENLEEATWIFLFRNQPAKTAEGLAAADMKMLYPVSWRTEVEEIPVTDARMARNWPGSLWRVRITDAAAREHHAQWRFRRRNDP
ncbi:MAG: heparinase II/III family protein [Clostridia bacterium]|nr:heparinase II/III family protein [Clostridia bacterium]